MRYVAQLSRFAWALNLGLLVAVVSLVVMSVLPTRSSQGTVDAISSREEPQRAAPQEGSRSVAVDPKLILEQDIFHVGQAAAKAATKAQNVPPVSPQPEPKPDVPLRLLGTVVDEGGASYAVIENTTLKSQDVYRVGDAIGNVRVNRIEQNRVVLLNAGVLQTLDLALTGPGPAPAAVVAQAPEPGPEAAAPTTGAMVRATSATQRQINTRASVENVSKAAEFLQKVKLTPHQTDGKPDGLALAGLGDSVFSQLSGFRDGDVIQSVNGHPVPDRTKASQVLRKAQNLGSARIEFQRGQESRTLTFGAGSW